MPASNDTIREIAKALRRHVDAATLEKVVNELLDVPGNRSFREAIEALARELMRRWVITTQYRRNRSARTLPPRKNDWSLLTEEERRRKADELIAMIQELREPPMQPPPLVYRAE
jgi:hypothetical protein